jgi:excisionase family DNA binding protein
MPEPAERVGSLGGMSTAVYESDYLSIREAASMLGVAPITIRRKIETGELLAVQLGGPGCALRIERRALERWLEERTTP